MLEDILFWLGLIGFISGVLVGFPLLENDGDSFLIKIMLSLGIAIAMFVFISTLGGEYPLGMIFFFVSAFFGAMAFIIVAFTAGGNLRAAFVAGGLAGISTYFISNYLPHGSFGYTLHDIPTLINYCVTFLVGGLTYYLLRNWGRDGEKWD